MSDINKNEVTALAILDLLNSGGENGASILPNDAMEILTGVMLGVVTVGGITGTSTNGQFTIRIEQGDTSDIPVVCPKCGNEVCTCNNDKQTKH